MLIEIYFEFPAYISLNGCGLRPQSYEKCYRYTTLREWSGQLEFKICTKKSEISKSIKKNIFQKNS